MTSRERVLKALSFQEPDRVPLDLGGTIVSGIMAHALDRLRKYLGLELRPVKVYEALQMLGEVEMDVVERLGIDVLPLEPPLQFFGLRRENWKPWKLWDGTEVLVPGQFDVEVDTEGNWLLHTEGDHGKPVEGKMPRDGYYFDMPSAIDYHMDYTPPSLEVVKKENHLSTEELEFLQARAEELIPKRPCPSVAPWKLSEKSESDLESLHLEVVSCSMRFITSSRELRQRTSQWPTILPRPLGYIPSAEKSVW
jgi:hypothetical protein